MMKRVVFISLLLYLNLLTKAQQVNNCVTGCSDCQFSSNQYICSKCEQGFTLYNNQCLYQNCPSNYQLQRYVTKQQGQDQTVDTCRAICDASYIENSTYNLCQQTQLCPLSFVGSSNNSLGTIESIYQVNDQITMIVYPTYIKLINSMTGQQLQDMSSPNILTTLYFKNYLITFSTTNLVSEWIFETNFFRNIKQIQKGQLTKKSQFIDLGVDQQAITSYDDSQSLVYFSQIYLQEQPLSLDSTTLSFSYVGCALKVINQLVLCFGKNQKLIAKYLSIQSGFLNLQDVKQSDLCQSYAFNSNPIIQNLQINQVSVSQFLIIQQQSTQLIQIIYDKVGAQIDCKLIDLKVFPLQLRLVDQQESQMLFAVNYLTKLTLMDQNIQEILSITFSQSQFTDLAFFKYPNTNFMANYKLITIQASSQNIITYQINLINKSYTQLNAYPVIFTNPLKFESYGDKYIQSDQIKTFINADQLFIVNNNLQSVSADTDQVNYVVMPYQKKIIGHRDKINKMVYSENTQYLLTCSNDGSIIAWYTLSSLNPMQIYKITQNGQKCRDILIYQDTWVVALFSRLILIFQINNAFVSYSYSFQNPVSDVLQFILQFPTNILLYYDSQFTLLNGVDLKQISIGQYLDSQIISIVAVANYNLIIQNGSNSLQMYLFDPSQNYQFNKVLSQNYQSIYGDFSIIQIDNLQSNNFEVMLGCKKGAFVILDSKLTQKFYYQISQGFPTNIQKYQDNDTYILFCYSTEQNQIYLFFHYAIIRSQNKGYLYSRSYSLKFNVGLYPDKDYVGNTNISYMFLMPFSYFTLILKGTYRPLDQSVDYGYFVYLIGNTVTSFASKDNNNIQYYGSQSGLLSFDNSNLNSFSTFSLNSSLKSGTIKSVKTSPFFESIFVIHNDIDVHNIYTQQYNYTIKFSSQYSNNRVTDLIFSEKNNILLAFKSQQLLIKNFQTNGIFSFDQISQINGALIDEVNLKIFAYGSALRVFNFNLTTLNIITPDNIYNYQQCLLTSDLIICKVNNNILSIISKNTYATIANTVVTGLSNKFQVYVDELNKQIFLVDTIIQVFDFTGNLIGQITNINLSILNLQIFGNNIAVLTSTYIFIFQRQQLALIIYFKPTGGGNLLGYYYIADYNTLVYYADEIRYGQLFYFNLSTYQDDGFTISAYSELGIGSVVSLFYDSINSRLNYLDSVGVFYSVNFLSQRAFYNIINVYDFKTVGSPVVEQFYFKNQQQNSNQQISTTYYIFDQSNVLYSYKDFSQTYLTYFSNPIRNVFQIDIYRIVVFIFDDQILIYTYDQVDNNQIFSSNYVAQIQNPKARIFLTNELLLTTEKQLIHINYSFYKDGTNNWKKNVIDYSQNNEYLRNHLSFGSPAQQKIFISFSSGRVLCYDQATTNSQQIISPWQPQGNIINNFVKLFFKTNSYMILAYRYNIITLINLSDLQVLKQLDTTTLNNQQINQINAIFVDETYGQCFISFMYEKLIYVLDLKSFSFLQYLSFPNNQYNRFATTDQYILVYSNSQINLFSRGTLKYINQIKKINSSIQITSLNIINQNILIICMNTQLEIYLINSDKSIILIDSTPISNSEIVDAYQQQNDSNTMRIVGISDNGIFDKIINTQLYFQSTQTSVASSQSGQYSCYSSLSMVDRIQGQNIFSYLYNNNVLKIKMVKYRNPRTKLYRSPNSIQQFVKFIKSNKQYIELTTNLVHRFYSSDTEQVILYEDQLTISDGEFKQTSIQKDNQLLLSKQVNQPIINIQATTLNIVGIQYISNQGNILIQNSKIVNIQNSKFESNTSIDGGAFIFSTISEFINIINTIFSQNTALGSGGAIYLYQTSKLMLDEQSRIENNIAQIGGGIRIILTTGNPFQVINYESQIKNNIGIIFGKNIGIYPVRAILDSRSQNSRNLQRKDRNEEIEIAHSFQNNNLSYQNSIRSLQSEDSLSIFSFNSGDYLYLQVQLVDQYDQIVSFSVSQLSQEQYAQSVQAFFFSSLKVSAKPKSSRVLKLILTTNSFSSSQIGQNITINFRQCNQGEIFKDLTSTITICEICQSGFYSLEDPNKPQNAQNLSCLQCPSQASQCQGDQIVLKDGYWRQNNKTDDIFSCNQIIQTLTCKESDHESKEGCIKGFSGPLCQFCDESGRLWDDRYTFSVSDQLCHQCEQQYVYITYIIVLSLLLLFYLVVNILMFMNNYTYHSTCTYLRQLQIIPISVSCMKDKSTQYMKTLINYLQITSVLFQLNMKSDFTSLVNSTSYLGSPATNILSNSHCVYPSYAIEKYGTVTIKLFFTSIYPLFFLVIIVVGLFVCYKLKFFGIKQYYKYAVITILYTFFQPSLIKLFTLAISCRSIGNNSYVSLNFQIQCNDESYRDFVNYFITPYLVFLFIAPIYILILLYKNKKSLNYCTTKYRLGYFYLDYKPKYYFWEINKIYGKTFVIAFYTWYNQVDQSFSYQVVSLFICFTIIANSIFKPFVVKQIEILDSLSRVLILINIILQQLSQIYSYSMFTVLQYIIHISFVFGVFLIIFRLKLSNIIDQKEGTMLKFLKRWVHKDIINIFIIKNTNQMKVYKNWKKIQKNITNIIKHQAQKVQQLCETNTSKIMTSRNNKTIINTQKVKSYNQDSTLAPQTGQFGNYRISYENTSIFASQILNKQGQSQIQTPGIVRNCTIFKQYSEADQVTDNRYQDEIMEQINIDAKIQNIVESINDLDNIQQYEENPNQQANDLKNCNDFKTIIKLNQN
ncbi:WD domain, G-beta repeat protein (macronuclear) [Tetrahymena thermophila SB210]|uniref:WD domain, G-beta repeat protein n=1 Tax=Tetrahymena thermophila (strain SB210) TaxID=312017 RepID=W7X4D3_TETTS|nr:WD domain, G-beta repeat protein [Tetrahymena thermophila SB210]EWS71268.1 WD domain, G-beta repeat protein [Tetrahymena thermophila SB210]|eukprot:XP_012656200.1 WD domain, G-beta repeat protein [Tetrahymena thermophila SB210]